jgi:hypothetical protein
MVAYQLNIAEGYFRLPRYGKTPHFPVLKFNREEHSYRDTREQLAEINSKQKTL